MPFEDKNWSWINSLQKLTSEEVASLVGDYLGIDPNKLFSNILGSGENGTAYMLKTTKSVLKVTTDAIEARSAAVFMKQPASTVVKFYDVFQIKEEPEVFFIHMENLEPLDKETQIAIELFLESKNKEEIDVEDRFLKKDNYEFLKFNYFEYMKNNAIPSNIEVYARHFISWLYIHIQECAERSIVNKDMHPGNVMQDKNGQLKAIDIGGKSKAPNIAIEQIDNQQIEASMKTKEELYNKLVALTLDLEKIQASDEGNAIINKFKEVTTQLSELVALMDKSKPALDLQGESEWLKTQNQVIHVISALNKLEKQSKDIIDRNDKKLDEQADIEIQKQTFNL